MGQIQIKEIHSEVIGRPTWEPDNTIPRSIPAVAYFEIELSQERGKRIPQDGLRRFNLRMLLIATTLAALTLGAGQAAKNMTTEFYWCPWSLERPIKSD